MWPELRLTSRAFVIAFGCSIITSHVYERCGAAGIRRAVEPDSVVIAHAATGSVARTYNLLMDRARDLEDLEALVIVHEDAEIVDARCAEKLRAAFADPQVALVGCVGATGASGLAWWDGEEVNGSMTYHHNEAGGGALRPAFLRDPGPGTKPVDTVYGVLLALSPWAVRNLRFDESIGLIHGYDYDICRQARRAGRQVLVTDVEIAHHHTLDLITQTEVWVAAAMRAAEIWDEGDPDAPDEAWRRRARRAEADAAAARLRAASALLQTEAADTRYAQQVARLRSSASWRLTEPLRRANALRRAWRDRRAGRL
jgi:hypothetical protein